MLEEPYRWLEAIQNRREYIQDQMRGATPTFAVSRTEGVLLLGVGTGQSKVFEIYDRLGYCALGNPVDIEKLRQAAIEATHKEGFQRSPADVNLRRLVNFALCPLLKDSFERIFAPPLIVQSIFAEVGQCIEEDVLVRLSYDGRPHYEKNRVLVGHTDDDRAGEAARWLIGKIRRADSLDRIVSLCLALWRVIVEEKPLASIQAPRKRILEIQNRTIEAALLDRREKRTARFRRLQFPMQV